jgi:membrane associated rhomboid family serine protease
MANRESVANFPVVTLSLVAANCLVFIAEMIYVNVAGGDAANLMTFMMVPNTVTNAFTSDPSLMGTALVGYFSSLFMHGSAGHLLGTVIFLWLTGPAIERLMGSGKFTLAYFVCGVFASGTHYFESTSSTVPLLGAGGAVAGVLALFAMTGVAGRLGMTTNRKVVVGVLTLGWLGVQFYGSYNQLVRTPLDNVCYIGEIGGFVAGLVIAGLLMHRRSVAPRAA